MKNINTRVLLLIFAVLATVRVEVYSQEVAPKLAAALQHALDSMQQQLGVNGLSASLRLPDDALWAGGSGVSTFQPIDSILPEHVFATGSSTKTVTAACILQLADEGLLSLEDSLHHWLPGYPHISPNITIRQLLRHQSGLYDVLQNPSFQPLLLQDMNKLWELEEVIITFIQAPVFAPGSSWGYSNTNYLLLGMIIEAITGQSFHQEINQRFFDPLELSSFTNLAYDETPEKVAHLWLDLNGDGQLDDAHNFFTGWKSMFTATGPAGGYFAQPQDLARWMRTAMSGSLFSEETWAEANDFVSTPLPGGTQYGLGLTRRNYLGLTGLGHGGDISYSTSGVYFPEKDISIAVQANDASINSWNLAAVVRTLLNVYLECELLLDTEGLSTTQDPLLVSPNPFSTFSHLTFELPTRAAQLSIELTNSSGQAVWQNIINGANEGVHQIRIAPAVKPASGLYILNIHADGTLIGRQKVIVY